MRILVDAICPGCGEIHVDVWIDRDLPAYPHCSGCRLPLVRNRRFAPASAVKGDSIPGGVLIEHGLCNYDGTARRYDSHSEMAREAKQRGLTNWVEHKPDKGSDKSSLTQRFV